MQTFYPGLLLVCASSSPGLSLYQSLLKNTKVQLNNCEDLIDFIGQFMNGAASHLASRWAIQGGYTE